MLLIERKGGQYGNGEKPTQYVLLDFWAKKKAAELQLSGFWLVEFCTDSTPILSKKGEKNNENTICKNKA